MKLRRDIILFAAVAVSAVAGGWWLLANQPGGGIEAFREAERLRAVASRGHLPPAEAFRATVCADAPCVVVEAGGLTFIFAAGAGAATGIASLGLMHANVDAVLLPDLAISTVEGLPAVAAASARAGRRDGLKVFGPAGLLTVVDGANIMLSGSSASRLIAATEGEDQGLAGRVVFDSGVVTVRGFGGRESGQGRVFRIDFEGKALVLAGCLSTSTDISAAARGAKTSAAILMTGSKALSPGATCLDMPDATQASRLGGLAATLLVPATPSPDTLGAIDAWTTLIKGAAAPNVGLGVRGARIDLSGEAPRMLRP